MQESTTLIQTFFMLHMTLSQHSGGTGGEGQLFHKHTHIYTYIHTYKNTHTHIRITLTHESRIIYIITLFSYTHSLLCIYILHIHILIYYIYIYVLIYDCSRSRCRRYNLQRGELWQVRQQRHRPRYCSDLSPRDRPHVSRFHSTCGAMLTI